MEFCRFLSIGEVFSSLLLLVFYETLSVTDIVPLELPSLLSSPTLFKLGSFYKLVVLLFLPGDISSAYDVFLALFIGLNGILEFSLCEFILSLT